MMRLAVILVGLAFTTGMASADDATARGEALFRPCAACHMIGEGAVHRLGPHLNGVSGRTIGTAEGFRYSASLSEAGAEGRVWDDVALDSFLAAPRNFLPGTSMAFRGIRDAEDRAILIAYMIETGGAEAPQGEVAVDPRIAAVLDHPPDEAYGAFLSSECTACHSGGGEGIPRIAGLAPQSFAAGLLAYRDGTREHQVMNMLAARLGDEEIAALAAYFATLE
jgi:cytochrome c